MSPELGPTATAPDSVRALDVLENISDSVSILDRDFRYTYLNGRAEAMARKPRGEMIGRSLWELFPELQSTPSFSHLQRTMRERVHTHFEEFYAPYDLWVEVNAYPTADGLAMFVRDISDRKLAERKLRESEERYRRLFEATGDGILIVDDQGRYVDVNESYCRILKSTRQRLIGAHFAEFIPPERLQDAEQAFVRLRQGGSTPVDFPLRALDGTIVELAWTSNSYYLPGLYFCSCRDITEQKRNAQALQAREAESRRLLAALPDIISRLDRDLRIVYTSPAVERITGLPPEHFIGKTHLEAGLPAEIAELGDEALKKIFDSGEPAVIEYDFLSPNLGLRHLSATGFPEFDDHGNIVSVLAMIRDVTAQKRAETELSVLLAREQEARETAELLNQVGPMLAAELDLEKLAQSVTDVATKLTGAEFGSFFHNVENEKGEAHTLNTVSGVSREAFAGFPMPRNTDVFAPTFRGEGVVRSDDITKDPRGNNALHQGMLPVRSYLAVPVVSRSGDVLGGLFFGHSEPGRFTERHESIIAGIAAQAAIAMDHARLFEQAQWVQNELKRSNQELRRANKDLETFAYSASHDLQEPLRNVALSAQLLQRAFGGKLPEGAEQFMTAILQGAGRMENLVRDLLAYTRATQHNEGPSPDIDSAATLTVVLQNLRNRIDQSGAEITAGELPVVAIHEIHLAQLFQNLLSNALKYRSKETPRVHITAARQQGWWVFSMADNGIGIDPRYAQQIFGLFKRLHTRDQYPGSGIGLAICQRIVEQYGGRIWLERSAPGEGSVFCFSLPER